MPFPNIVIYIVLDFHYTFWMCFHIHIKKLFLWSVFEILEVDLGYKWHFFMLGSWCYLRGANTGKDSYA